MKKEKIILSFVAAFIGIVVAGVAFYMYQSTKTISPKDTEIALKKPTSASLAPTKSGLFLSVDSPHDEEVSEKKLITVTGKTLASALVVVSSDVADIVAKPAKNGNFSTTITLSDGANIIEITAIGQGGDEVKTIKTVTVSTESF